MSAEIIDGKAVAAEIDVRAGEAGAKLAKPLGRPPCLAVVLIGEDPASQVYVRNKVRRTEAAGLTSIEIRKPVDVSQAEAIDIVRTLNANPDVDGILVQLPLPDHIDANAVIETIDPDKDVDGLTEASAGRLVLGKRGLRPCTPTGCVDLAKRGCFEA